MSKIVYSLSDCNAALMLPQEFSIEMFLNVNSLIQYILNNGAALNQLLNMICFYKDQDLIFKTCFIQK